MMPSSDNVNPIFPDKTTESWKYTRIKGWSEQNLAPKKQAMELKNSREILLIDGNFGSLIPEMIATIIPNSTAMISTDPSLLLSQKYLDQALKIHIKKDQKAKLELHHILNADEEKAAYSAIYIELETGAKLDLLEVTDGDGKDNYFYNQVIIANIQEEAIFNHYRISGAPKNATSLFYGELIVGKSAEYHNFTLQKGGKITRQQLEVKLVGEKAKSSQYGIVIGKNNEHHDAFLPIYHLAKNTSNSQEYRQIMDDVAKAIFYGKIIVPEDVTGVESHQLNKNLLISEDAEIVARPELDILNDDVICSHGATIGQLDLAAIYYLQTRGISFDDATKLLMEGFLSALVEKIGDDGVRMQVEKILYHAN